MLISWVKDCTGIPNQQIVRALMQLNMVYTLYYYVNIDSLDVGFCNCEKQNTDHSQYIWSETHVGKIDRQTCVFGNKDGFPESANATRFCMAPEQWMEYVSTACLSEQTSRIQNLTKVLPFEHLVYNINVFC